MLMLKESREASGMKIAQVAERAGVPYETCRKWEKGDSDPNWEQLCRVADVPHCSLDDLTGRRETLTQEELTLLARWRTMSSISADIFTPTARGRIGAALMARWQKVEFSCLTCPIVGHIM